MPVRTDDIRAAADAAIQQFNGVLVTFLAACVYFGVALSQISDADYITSQGQTLPIIGSTVPTEMFFRIGPLAIFVVHVGLLVQWTILRRRVKNFLTALQTTPPEEREQQLELLYPLLPVEATAPYTTSFKTRYAAIGITLLCVVVIPVLLLVWVQVRALAFHLTGLTWTHRILVLSDLSVIWIYLWRPTKSVFKTVSGEASLVATILLVVYVCVDAVIPCTQLQSLPAPYNLTDRIRERRLDLRGAYLQARDSANGPTISSDHGVLYLVGSDLRYADLSSATFVRAALYGALFRGALMNETRFVDSTFQPVTEGGGRASSPTSFAFALASEADFTNLDLHNTDFTGAVLVAAKLVGCNLQSANFEAASLDLAHLEGADLARANLRLASLIGADLQFATLTRADFTGADLRGALFDKTPLFDTLFNLADLTYAAQAPPDSDEVKQLMAALGSARQSPQIYSAKKTVEGLATAQLEASNDRGILGIDGRQAWLMQFDFLPTLYLRVAEPLADADYVRIWQRFVEAELQRAPEIRLALTRRKDLARLFASAIKVRDQLPQVSQPNDPPLDTFQPSVVDAGPLIGQFASSESRFNPWTTDSRSSVPDAGSHDPQWLTSLISMFQPPGKEPKPKTAVLKAALWSAADAGDSLALAVYVRLEQLWPDPLDKLTRDRLLSLVQRRNPDAATLLAVATLIPRSDPMWITLMQKAAEQSGEAAWTLGVNLNDDSLKAKAAGLRFVLAEGFIGQQQYQNPRAARLQRADAWNELTHAAWRGETLAQLAVGLFMSTGGDYAHARRWLEAAASSGDPLCVETLASFLATVPDARYGDPDRALVLALEAFEKMQTPPAEGRSSEARTSEELSLYSTLSEAYAATGNYPEAIAVERRMLSEFSKSLGAADRSDINAHIAAYRARIPWRNFPFPPAQ